MIGTIKTFDSNLYTGSIDCKSTGEELSFSLSAIASNYKNLHIGQRVRFTVEQGSQDKGPKVATNVTVID